MMRFRSLLVVIFLINGGFTLRQSKIGRNFLRNLVAKKCRADFYYNFSRNACVPCSCDKLGSEGVACQQGSGQCNCKVGYNGQKCAACGAGYYKDHGLGNVCVPCDCSRDGSKSIECDRRGSCRCKSGIGGKTCNRCLNSNRNFRKECTEDCPEMYRPVAKDFDEFLELLDRIETVLDNLGMAKSTLNEFKSKIDEMKEEISRISMDPKLGKLRDALQSLKKKIKVYVKRSGDLKKLLDIINEVMRVLRKLEKNEVESKQIQDICVKACVEAETFEKNRELFLVNLVKIRNEFDATSERADNVRDETKKWSNKADHNEKWAEQNADEAAKLIVPNFDREAPLKPEREDLKKTLKLLGKIRKEVEGIGELYENTKELQENYVLKTIESFNELVLDPYESRIDDNIKTLLDNLGKYEEELNTTFPELSFRDNLTHHQRFIETNLDKLQKFQIQAEKFISDNQLTNETLTEIFELLSGINSTVRNGTELLQRQITSNTEEEQKLDEKYAQIQGNINGAIGEMGMKTERLEEDLVEIAEDMVETQKEIDVLEEVSLQLETIKFLSGEVRKLKDIEEELDKLDKKNLCGVELA